MSVRTLPYARMGLDPQRAVVHLGPMLMDTARRNREQADHYAGFKVGAVVLGATLDGDLAIFSAANQNTRPGKNPTKMCAERIALQKLEHHNFDEAVAIFTSGPVQPDTQTGRSFPTLPTCGECRDDMKTKVASMHPSTLIVTVHPQEDLYEIYTFEEYQQLHEQADGHLPVAFSHHEDPGFKRWLDAREPYDFYINSNFAPNLGIEPAKVARLAITGQLDRSAI